jgi:hypothetical protein
MNTFLVLLDSFSLSLSFDEEDDDDDDGICRKWVSASENRFSSTDPRWKIRNKIENNHNKIFFVVLCFLILLEKTCCVAFLRPTTTQFDHHWPTKSIMYKIK